MQALRMEDLTLGQRLKVARQRAGLSQQALAEAVSIGTRTLVDYEADRRPIPSDVLHRICQHLEVSADWLLWGRSQATPP
ncbi:MAG TPA: helix-turn-helix transcriptional regulator [Actinomycetota bacterium]|nr:helix-turn-helix transcriptional regulator [Actinomycetota bacterium]